MPLSLCIHSGSMWWPQSKLHAASRASLVRPHFVARLACTRSLASKHSALSARHALAMWRTHRPQLVVADGVIVAGKAREQQRNVPDICLHRAAAARRACSAHVRPAPPPTARDTGEAVCSVWPSSLLSRSLCMSGLRLTFVATHVVVCNIWLARLWAMVSSARPEGADAFAT